MQESKPSIIVCPFSLMAHYLRCIELARHLSDEYRIFFLGSPSYNKFIKDEGFEIIDFSETYPEVVEKAKNFDFSWLNYQNINSTIDQLTDIFKKYKPEYVISDTFLGAGITAERCNIPQISLLNAYLTKYYNDMRPVPDNHRANTYKKFVFPALWNFIVKHVEKKQMRKVHLVFREIRKKYNLKTKSDLLEEFQGDYNIICDDDEIFPTKNLPDTFFTIGPLLYKNKKSESEAELIQKIFKNNNKKCIYVSMGSSGDLDNLYFLSDSYFDDYNVIVSSKNFSIEKDNFFIKEFINFDIIKDYISLFICHGGNGTVCQSLSAGIPLLLMPSNFEQEWNVHRFKKLKLAEVHYKRQGINDVLEKIDKQLKKLLKNNYFHFSRKINSYKTSQEIRAAFWKINASEKKKQLH